MASRLLGKAVIQSPKDAPVSKIAQLRAEIFAEPVENAKYRTVHSVMRKPLHGEMFMAHWSVKEVWEWPMAEGASWINIKKKSIDDKIATLRARGKGPKTKEERQKSHDRSSNKK